jgi:ankyrin repeat protein
MARDTTTGHKKLILRAALTLLLIGIILFLSNQQINAEEAESSIDRTIALVTMVSGQLSDSDSFGAGIIFGRKNEQVYVVTANHIVRKGSDIARNIRVQFKNLPEETFPASLLVQANPSLDIAVLRVNGLEERGIDFCSLPLDSLGNIDELKRGDLVFPVGQPGGMKWGMPIQSDFVAQIKDDRIFFQSSFVDVGHSGGGLFDYQGRLVGMIIYDQPPFGRALRIENVIMALQELGIPVQLHKIQGEWSSSPLHDEVKNGNLDNVVKMIEGCARVNLRDNDGMTPLHLASFHEDERFAEMLLEAGADVNAKVRPTVPWSQTPLHIASKSGAKKVAELLVKYGGNVNAKGTDGRSPLHMAVISGHLEIIEFLLAHGAEVNIKAAYDLTPLHDAAVRNSPQFAQILIDAGADVDSEGKIWMGTPTMPLHIAAKHNSVNVANILLANGASVDAGLNTPLYEAAKYGSINVAELLFDYGALIEGRKTETPLNAAMRFANEKALKSYIAHDIDANLEQHMQVAKLLISRGADVNSTLVPEKITPLHYAVALGPGAFEIAKLLLARGADVDAVAKGYHYQIIGTPLQIAVNKSLVSFTDLFLKYGANVNIRGVGERTPLHVAAALGSRVEDGRGGFRLSVAVGVSFDTPPQSDLP